VHDGKIIRQGSKHGNHYVFSKKARILHQQTLAVRQVLLWKALLFFKNIGMKNNG